MSNWQPCAFIIGDRVRVLRVPGYSNSESVGREYVVHNVRERVPINDGNHYRIYLNGLGHTFSESDLELVEHTTTVPSPDRPAVADWADESTATNIIDSSGSVMDSLATALQQSMALRLDEQMMRVLLSPEVLRPEPRTVSNNRGEPVATVNYANPPSSGMFSSSFYTPRAERDPSTFLREYLGQFVGGESQVRPMPFSIGDKVKVLSIAGDFTLKGINGFDSTKRFHTIKDLRYHNDGGTTYFLEGTAYHFLPEDLEAYVEDPNPIAPLPIKRKRIVTDL